MSEEPPWTAWKAFLNGLFHSTTTPVIVQDLGTHTNPRLYEKTNGFASARVAIPAGPVVAPIWATGLAAVYPAAGRTAGKVTTIYTLVMENPTGAAVLTWLQVGTALITPIYHLNATETAVITFAAGMNVGDVNISCGASAVGVVFQIIGTEA